MKRVKLNCPLLHLNKILKLSTQLFLPAMKEFGRIIRLLNMKYSVRTPSVIYWPQLFEGWITLSTG